jgi:branched-subunit amino acid aminotransferase/4-amino-4-deoxychorismate lyase
VPDEIIVVDHSRDRATRLRYDFEVGNRSTVGLPREGSTTPYAPKDVAPRACDHEPGEYAAIVRKAQEAFRRGAYEGVMRNYRGELAECTTSNLFVVKNGVALTPPIDAGLLPGITRAFLFEVGEEANIPVRESVLHDEDLFGADEVFFTSTTRGVVPATRVDDRVIGNGAPGPITRALGAAYQTRALASTDRP